MNSLLFAVRHIVPAALWAGGMVALPLMTVLPGQVGSVGFFLGCLAAHVAGGCWWLIGLGGDRRRRRLRLVIPAPATLVLALFLVTWGMDEYAMVGATISGGCALFLWAFYVATRRDLPEAGQSSE